jgi:hypothetical protein
VGEGHHAQAVLAGGVAGEDRGASVVGGVVDRDHLDVAGLSEHRVQTVREVGLHPVDRDDDADQSHNHRASVTSPARP